jgi:hypothetical protein
MSKILVTIYHLNFSSYKVMLKTNGALCNSLYKAPLFFTIRE